ncbi:MAG TPA: FG-GAP repeat protein [Actinomycetota bacterium]|nr:FG-GAP repeat protein [Actinomycetota bacterium]
MSKGDPRGDEGFDSPNEFDQGAGVRGWRIMTMKPSLGSRPALRAFALSLCLTAGLLLPIPSATATEELVKLTASDGAVLGHFGNHVDVSGDTAVVGAPGMHGNPRVGAAYVFTRAGDKWVEQAKLTPSDGGPGDRFGWSVAISGDTIVVGACWDDVGINVDQGSAYVFTRTGGTWTEQAKLTSSNGFSLDWFGISVEVSGDVVVVGTWFHGEEFGVPPEGSAYVFARSGGTWTQQAELIPSDGYVGNGFGFKVGVDGDTAVVGAYGDSGAGSAYVFTRTGGTWTQQEKLTASDRAAGDRFGFWVGISGQTVVVGALFADVTYADQGAAYVFTRTGGDWAEQKKLTASDGRARDAFGRSVAVSGDTVVVGAQFHDKSPDRPDDNDGAAYVFNRTGETWTEQTKLTAADGDKGDLFGVSVAVDRGTAVVGASFKDVGEGPIYAQGAAYAWKDDAAGGYAPGGGSASPGRSKEQQARSGAGLKARPASVSASPSSASTVAGTRSGAGDPGDPSQAEPPFVDQVLPASASPVKDKDLLPTSAVIALLLATMTSGGFGLKKRLRRTTP